MLKGAVMCIVGLYSPAIHITAPFSIQSNYPHYSTQYSPTIHITTPSTVQLSTLQHPVQSSYPHYSTQYSPAIHITAPSTVQPSTLQHYLQLFSEIGRAH